MGNLNSLQNFFSALFLLLSAELSFCKTQKQLDEEWNARNYPNPTISNDFRRCGMKSKVCFSKVLVLYYFRGSYLVRAVRRPPPVWGDFHYFLAFSKTINMPTDLFRLLLLYAH